MPPPVHGRLGKASPIVQIGTRWTGSIRTRTHLRGRRRNGQEKAKDKEQVQEQVQEQKASRSAAGTEALSKTRGKGQASSQDARGCQESCEEGGQACGSQAGGTAAGSDTDRGIQARGGTRTKRPGAGSYAVDNAIEDNAIERHGRIRWPARRWSVLRTVGLFVRDDECPAACSVYLRTSGRGAHDFERSLKESVCHFAHLPVNSSPVKSLGVAADR
jgi:hypothetical protein